MPHADFVHLRVHSAYSLSEGAIKMAELVRLCGEARMPAAALTDNGNLFGVMEFSLAAAEAGLQPIVGCVLGVSRESEAPAGARRAEPDDLVLLVQNEAGYRNLMKLSSVAFLDSEPGSTPQVPMRVLKEHAGGLIALTGGTRGALGRLLAEGQVKAAEGVLAELATVFAGRLYIELQRHGLEVESKIEAALVDLAYRYDLPLVATNDVYFAGEDMYEAHDALLCVAQGTYVAEAERRRLTPEHRFKSAGEMRELFRDLPEAVDNTLVVARRCAYMVPVQKSILPAYATESGRDEAEELRAVAAEGLEHRLAAQLFRPGMSAAETEAAAKPYRERLDYELGVIIDMNYPGYFLIVADFIRWAKSQGIPVGPGRGSGAGSVVAWALQITDLDPLRFGLLFERFLNPARISMPDFDIDFCQERRDEVIDYVRQKYGADRVAQIITFGKLQARAVLRDVGRVLQVPYPLVDRICKKVPYNPASPVSLSEAIDGDPSLQEMRDSDPAVARLMGIALKLEGLYRHASTHAAGVVIADRPLEELVPLYRDPRSEIPATQFSMKYVELAGLVKFDFLGLKTLTVIDKARKLLKRRGIDLDIDSLPLDDPETFALLGQGRAVGIFQLESSGMRDALHQLQPDRFEDIIALVALYRPGPMDNIPRYIACKHGKEEPNYLDERLTDTLRETFGVIIYQEQVMEIARVLAGYSLGQADILRRAMGKKIKSEMNAQRETFIEGAVERGVGKAKAEEIFDLVAKFAGYGFNKSHAAAYALVAYQTAYLKAHYPVEFLAASMTLDLGNTDKINVFHQELDRLAIPLLPPDVNHSSFEFTVEQTEEGGGAIRYALPAIKNVGVGAVRAIVADREANGAFEDVFDFAMRAGGHGLNKRLLESLVRAGAFDGLNANRAQLFGSIDSLLRYGATAAEERDSQQTNLFGGEDSSHVPPPGLSAVEDWPPMERLNHEHDAIGFYLSAHPLDAYGASLDSLGATAIAQAPERIARGVTSFKLAGVVLSKQERMSSNGRYAFVRLSDTSGTYEIAVFREVYAGTMDILEPGRALLINATARRDGDMVKFTANGVEELDRLLARLTRGIQIRLDPGFDSGNGVLRRLRAILDEEARGKAKVSFLLALDNSREVEIELPGCYALSARARAAIRDLPGVASVADLRA
jgi:DNA polymerase-3 subunit alpha